MRPIPWQVSAALLALVVSMPLLADPAERLEADLRGLFSTPDAVTIGKVERGVLRSRVSAEDIVFRGDDGERLSIERYVVSGDYDRPDEVILEGLRLDDGRSEPALVAMERIVLGAPSQAVFALDGSLAPGDVRIASLAIDGTRVDLASALARDILAQTELDGAQGYVTIARLRGEGLSHTAIQRLEATDIAGMGESLEAFGAGAFTLAALTLEGLQGLDDEATPRLDALVLSDLAIDAEGFVGSLARLRLDGDFGDGEGGLEVEALRADLARMIALAPEEQRAQLRMASNVLTDGSGELRLDAALLGQWEAGETQSLITSESRITVHEALGLELDIELPVALPEGVSPEAVLADVEVLELARLLGGEVTFTLAEQGLFGRMVTLGAAMEGVSEAQYLEQARTQAEGFGMLLGPELQQFLLGLVALSAGDAEVLEMRVTLPAESNLETYTDDPLALPGRLSLRVETR